MNNKPIFSKPAPTISKPTAVVASIVLTMLIAAVGIQWQNDRRSPKATTAAGVLPAASKSQAAASAASSAAAPDSSSVMLVMDGAAANAAIAELAKARTSVTAQLHQINRPELVDALMKAAKSNVKVQLLLSQSSATYAKKTVEGLIAAGVEVTIDKGTDMLSGSLIVIDKKKVVAGSMWFGKSASRGLEHMIVSERLQLVAATQAAIDERVAAGLKP